MLDKVYIIIVNWNGWRDTIECLESVFRNTYPTFQVLVCDNGSTDESVEAIREWAAGRVHVSSPAARLLQQLTMPPLPKPISLVECDRETAEAGCPIADAKTPLILIRTGSNLGFAGGCNVGLRCALARGDFSYIWLLNNDTVISPDALSALVVRMKERQDAGQCGSRLVFYDTPDVIQAHGGAIYNPWLGLVKPVGAFTPANAPVDVSRIERSIDYIVGASLLVSRPFLIDIGQLNENYFLYHEEIDWATRARGRYALAYAHESIVYHKEGQSTEASSRATQRSALSDFYGIRNRLRFTRTYYPFALPTVYAGLLMAIMNRLRRGQPRRALEILRIIFSPETYTTLDSR